MNEITKLQRTVQEERQKAQELTVWLHTKENMIREMWVRDSLLRKHQERVQKMREERDSLSKELRKCKDENYNLAMSYARQSEEKSSALMKNRDLLLEVSDPVLKLPPSYLIPEGLCCASDVSLPGTVWPSLWWGIVHIPWQVVCLSGPWLSPVGPCITSCALKN